MFDVPKISIVVPCFNEQEVINDTCARLNSVLQGLVEKEKISRSSNICFIDDGSTDNTWSLIEALCLDMTNVRALKLARNVGHQNALLAGLLHASGDAILSIDADLQDDIDVIELMVDKYTSEQAHIVYGVRKKRDSDAVFKRNTAKMFYKIMRLLGVDLIEDHADFRLMSTRAINELSRFQEANLFLRGIIPLIGLRTAVVYYNRLERMAGVSKYPLMKMLSLALNGITSFSVVPLRMISVLGFLIFIVSMMLGTWSLIVTVLYKETVPGWASTVLPMYFLGGIQLLCVGVIGEYIGKIYGETKARPKYIIEKEII